MSNTRKLIVEVVGDDAQFQRTVLRTKRGADDIERSLKRTTLLSRAADSNQAARGALTGARFGNASSLLFGSGAFVGAAAATTALRVSVTAASDLNEELQKSNVIFGENAKVVADWSKSLAKSFGLSQEQALQASAIFGSMFRNTGQDQQRAAELARTLTELGADLASFNNTSVDDALAAIRSGLSGEIEPLRRYQVFLTEAAVAQRALADTGKSSVKELTQGERIMARYELLLQQTQTAQGDFARTSGGLANQQRILAAQSAELAANLGEFLIPAVTDIVGKLNDAASAANAFADAIGKIGGVKLPSWIEKPAGFLKDIAGGFFNSGGGFFIPPPPKFKGLPATGNRPSIFAGLLDGLTKPTPQGPFGGAKELPVIKDLSEALRSQELQARISGSVERLRAVLEREGAVLRSAIVNSFGLKPKERNALRQQLLSVTDELRAMDKAQADELKRQAEDAKQAARERLQSLQDMVQLRLDGAQETRAVGDDLRQLNALEKVLTQRIAAEGRTADLLRQLGEVRRQRINTKQFAALGLTATGEEPIPGTEALKKQLASVSTAIEGSFLDTRKTQGLLARIRRVLSGGLGDVAQDVRSRIKEMLDGIDQEIDKHGRRNATSFRHSTLSSILGGLNLDRRTSQLLSQRIAQLGPGGTVPGRRSAAFALANGNQPINVHTTVQLDGEVLGRSVTRVQRKQATRRTTSRRGPYAGHH